MKKKTYAKPFFVVERFYVQEFCNPCNATWQLITNDSDWSSYSSYKYIFVDLDNDGKYDAGERFLQSTGVSDGTPNKIYEDGLRSVYWLTGTSTNTDLSYTIQPNYFPSPASYTASSLSTTNNIKFRFQKKRSFTVKVENNQLYRFLSGTIKS